jgi:hypothetical protein
LVSYEIEYKDKELEVLAKPWGEDFFPFFPKEAKIKEYFLILHYENLEQELFETKVQIITKEKKIKILSTGKAKKTRSNDIYFSKP